ncbi:MAG: mRNA surveillance protein pelota [bacterium]|nr:mRNA surveillance protein pelota [bacterium]
MKIIKQNMKKCEVTLLVQSLDDLWYLNQLVDAGDLVSGKTFRKVKLGKEDDRNTKSVKKPISITLNVERTEFHKYTTMLRIVGTVAEGPEEVPKGSHHTFNVEEGTVITIKKESWLNYQVERLKEASSQKSLDILICALDRDEAVFALLKQQGYKTLSRIKGDVQKKDFDEKSSSFYDDLIKKLKEYVQRHKIRKVLIASPAFWKEELLKGIKDEELRKKITLATCSSLEGALDELLKRSELAEILKEERTASEATLMEELLLEVSKEGHAAYGFKETKAAVEAGAAKILLISDSMIHKKRIDNTFADLDYIMRTADSMKAKIVILNSENNPGKKLDGLGGIASILRYKLNY